MEAFCNLVVDVTLMLNIVFIISLCFILHTLSVTVFVRMCVQVRPPGHG